LGGETVFDINTPLFDPKNRENSEKISYVIRQNFNGEQVTIPEHLTPFVSQVYLHDVLDFSRKEFNKAFNLSAQSKVEIETKWDLINLGELCDVITKGTTPTTLGYSFKDEGINFIKIESIHEDSTIDPSKFAYIDNECHEKLKRSQLKKDDLLFSIAGALGRVYQVEQSILPANTNQALAIIRLSQKRNIPHKYVKEILKSDFVQAHLNSLKVGIAQPNLSLAQISNFKIPLPPLDIQQKIVKECEAVDLAVNTESQKVATANQEIAEIILKVKANATHKFKIGQLLSLEYGKSLPEQKRVAGEVPVMGSNGISGYHNESLCDGPAVIVGRKGSAGKVTYIERSCFPIDTTFYVKPMIESNMKFIYYLLNSLELEKSIVGIGVPGINRHDIYQLEIPNISLAEQEKIIQKIKVLEAQIAQAQKLIDDAPQQKQAILQKYL